MSVGMLRRWRRAQIRFCQKHRTIQGPCYARATSPDDHITVRDWRRRPPLPLTVPRRQHQASWGWIGCTSPTCRHYAAIVTTPFITAGDRVKICPNVFPGLT
jgi:hypothetical protein